MEAPDLRVPPRPAVSGALIYVTAAKRIQSQGKYLASAGNVRALVFVFLLKTVGPQRFVHWRVVLLQQTTTTPQIWSFFFLRILACNFVKTLM